MSQNSAMPLISVAEFCDAFNFGPHVTNNKSVKELVEEIIENWGSGSWKWISPQKVNYESSLLNLNIDKSYHKLHWLPKWNFEETIARTVEWYQMAGRDSSRMQEFTLKQIKSYQGDRSTGSRSSLAQETKFNF